MRPAVPLFPFLLSVAIAAPAMAQTPSRTDPPFGNAASISNAELDAIAGKADVAMTVNANNRSDVSHNSVSGTSVTGTISFDGSSFSDLNGLSVLNANTGNNVAINSSLNVNVAIRP